MIGNDWTRIAHRWLEHPEWGVMAMLAKMEKPVGDIVLLNDVDDKSCQGDYRPTGGTQYLVVGSERADRPVESGGRRGTDKHDHVGLGVFYMTSSSFYGQAIRDHAEPILDAVQASLLLLGQKGFVDKIEPPADGGSWQEWGRAKIVSLEDYTGLRFRASAQTTDAVPVAALFARVKGLRSTFTPTGVA